MKQKIIAEFGEVDTYAGELEALTPYFYSSISVSKLTRSKNKVRDKKEKKMMIIGGGPNRIGQGVEFDYVCVHASFALKDLGIETIMYNCNPETVSIDYDTSDILYLGPIDFEHLRGVIEREKSDGVIVHFGDQTPLKFAKRLSAFGTKIIGTSARVIDMAEDRKKFAEFITKLGINQPENSTATSVEEAVLKASEIGCPVLVRPNYVLGGRAVRVVTDESELKLYMQEAVDVSDKSPVLIDQYLDNAIEIDVDVISDSKDVYVVGIMEHIEEAGIHSGDSAYSLPPCNIDEKMQEQIVQKTADTALNLGAVGLLNIQFTIYNNELYMIEINPRASRTVPSVSKVTSIPLAKVVTRIMWQGNLKEVLKFYDAFDVVNFDNAILRPGLSKYIGVKETVFPFTKPSGNDLELGPEMRSTGEVMDISKDFANSYVKSQISSFNRLPESGVIFISLEEKGKKYVKKFASEYSKLGFKLMATSGTYKEIVETDFECELVHKTSEGRPNVEDKLKNGEIQPAINTSDSHTFAGDTKKIRENIIRSKILYFINLRSALAGAKSIKVTQNQSYLEVKSLQGYLRA